MTTGMIQHDIETAGLRTLAQHLQAKLDDARAKLAVVRSRFPPESITVNGSQFYKCQWCGLSWSVFSRERHAVNCPCKRVEVLGG